jgi:DNA adenine methylase
MCRHLHYVEPFAGGLSVLLARDPDDPNLWLSSDSAQRGVSELVSDIDGPLMNFWAVLRDPALFEKFIRIVQAIPLARCEWEKAHTHRYGEDQVTDAVNFFVDARQSLAGRRTCFTAITRNRTRRGINGTASEWVSAVDGLPAVHARLRPVIVDKKPALDIIRREDTPGTLYYLDPPYVSLTRASPTAYGEFEMTDHDHREFLEAIRHIKGRAMVSGYRCGLYDDALRDWNRHEFELPNNAAGGSTKRRMVETLWCNF